MLSTTDQINTFEQEREAIESRFSQMFDTSIVPVQYGNVSVLKKGTMSVATPYKGPEFVRLNIIGGPATQQEVLRNFTTISGIIKIGVFVGELSGSNRARQIADQIWPIFNAVKFNGITTGPMSTRELPPNNGWYNLDMQCEYTWYRCLR